MRPLLALLFGKKIIDPTETDWSPKGKRGSE